MCKTVGQNINNWGYGSKVCKEEDIFTEEKKVALIGTFKNLENYFSRLLNVTRLTNPIQLRDMHSFSGLNGKKVSNVDLHIAVVVRAFSDSSDVLGAAFFDQRNSYDKRPITGGLYLNSYYVPKTILDENSQERMFFELVFHELCHVLGIISSPSNWIDKTTGKTYSYSPVQNYYSSKYSKKFSIIVTPAAHSIIKKRTGLEYFDFGNENNSRYTPILSGIEIEDGGGSGTIGAHPESRVFLDDIMAGISVSRARISEITLALLDDTGYYDVNYSMAEPYPYGDMHPFLTKPKTTTNLFDEQNSSIDEENVFSHFYDRSPMLSFPKNHLCWDIFDQDSRIRKYNLTRTYQCSYDYRAISVCAKQTHWNCSKNHHSPDPDACQQQAFINPLNESTVGQYDTFDYMKFKVSSDPHYCNYIEGENESYPNRSIDIQNSGQFYSEESMCAMSSLAIDPDLLNISSFIQPRCYHMKCTNNRLYINVSDQYQKCDYENQKLYYNGYTGFIICPNPQVICNLKQYYGNPIYEDIDPEITSTPTTSESITSTPTTSELITSTPTTSELITSTPITSTPITSTPTTSELITSTPITSTPITSTPITSTPITSTPITSTPITSTPIASESITSELITSTTIVSGSITEQTNQYSPSITTDQLISKETQTNQHLKFSNNLIYITCFAFGLVILFICIYIIIQKIKAKKSEEVSSDNVNIELINSDIRDIIQPNNTNTNSNDDNNNDSTIHINV